MAALRGQRDIAVGNVVGSNTFNILSVLGISASIAPAALPVAPAMLAFDLPVMLAVAIACLPIFGSGHVIRRWEGFFLLGGYAAYTTYLALAASQHQALPAFTAGLQLFLLPLAAVTLLALGWTAWRERRTARRD
jgi:cation:H+ antiporter